MDNLLIHCIIFSLFFFLGYVRSSINLDKRRQRPSSYTASCSHLTNMVEA